MMGQLFSQTPSEPAPEALTIWGALFKNSKTGTSLAAQWLRLHASTAGGAVLALVGELGSCMWCRAVKKKKKKEPSLVSPPPSSVTQVPPPPWSQGGGSRWSQELRLAGQAF